MTTVSDVVVYLGKHCATAQIAWEYARELWYDKIYGFTRAQFMRAWHDVFGDVKNA